MASSFSYHRARALRDWCDLGPERAELMAALGGVTLEVVDRLYAHGVRATTLYALEWLPAVDVCWIDGADEAERHAMRTQFVADPGTTRAGLALLEDWLTTRPAPALLAAAWYAIGAQLAVLDAEDRAATLARIVARCHAAGRASGAGLDRGPLSRLERQHIGRLQRAIRASAAGDVDLGLAPPAVVH